MNIQLHISYIAAPTHRDDISKQTFNMLNYRCRHGKETNIHGYIECVSVNIFLYRRARRGYNYIHIYHTISYQSESKQDKIIRNLEDKISWGLAQMS